MKKPSEPMLEEFRLIAEADPSKEGWLEELSERICDLFTDDCLLEDTSTDEVTRGRSELWDYCMGLFGPFSNIRIEPQEIIDAGNVSTMLLHNSADHTGEAYGYPATGRRVSWTSVAIFRCNEDNTLVERETLAYDTNYIISQIKDD